MRECYVRIDDAESKGYDFAWQCDLMKCIAYCLREEEACTPITSTFVTKHCEKAKETDLTSCDVTCAGAVRFASPGAVPAVLTALAGAMLSWQRYEGAPVAAASL